MKKIIKTSKAPAPIGSYNQAIRASGNILYISGQIALIPSTNEILKGSIEEETQQVMANIGAILEAANIGFEHLVKTSIFIKKMKDFPRINQIYSQYFESHDAPARETVEVSSLPKNVNIEISAIASFL